MTCFRLALFSLALCFPAVAHSQGTEAALAAIEKCHDTSCSWFSLGNFEGLTEIPPEVLKLTSLQTLSLGSKSTFTDLTPLQKMPWLQTLDLSGASSVDLADINELKALQTLVLARVPEIDLSEIAVFKALTSLDLSRSGVTDLGPLASLTALRSLSIKDTQVNNLRPLSGLRAMEDLTLDTTPVWDIAPLAALSGLGFVAEDRGELEIASGYYRESLTASRENGFMAYSAPAVNMVSLWRSAL